MPSNPSNSLPKSKPTAVVGMSGGVDSSVTALLLKEQGYHVVGLFMKNWEEKDESGICHSAEDFDDVRRVCEQLDIPYYGVNFVNEYRDLVFSSFIEDLKKGLTPNPDILCNREIKFNVFLKKALELGADFLATGHYCRNVLHEGYHKLLKGLDPGKDQTYFLYTVNQSILEKVLFPVGDLQKKEVREIARKHNLFTSEKKDSTGICFIGERHFRTFLSQHISMQPGYFETLDGKRVGNHQGTAFYTIGQRKGMGIGGPGDPWFVVGKDVEKKIVYVEQGAENPALYSSQLYAKEFSWVSDKAPNLPLKCKAKVRYRQTEQPCTLHSIEDGVGFVTFDEPQRAVTPGQSIVFYQDANCLGGGIIQQNH